MSERVKNILAVALVAVLGWMLYAQLSGISLIPGAGLPEVPEAPDLGPLEELGVIASVSPVPLLGGTPQYDLGGRNLFQYGQAKPPPPSAEELERRRLAEEARLKALEEAARRRREEMEAAQKARDQKNKEALEALQQEKDRPPPPPPRKVKAPPPPIDLQLIGYLGPMNSRIAVFYKAKGKEIVLGKKGEVIEGRFRVISIGAESVEMGYVDPEHSDARKTIQLGS